MNAPRHYHILVIDDDAYNRDSLGAVLQKLGYKVELATNGMHGLTKLNSGLLTDLVITDLVMPVMNGQQMLKSIRADAKLKDLPVMLMSASTDKSLIMDTVEFGITKLFIKPLNYNDTAEKVQAFFKEQEAKNPPAPANSSETNKK